MTSSMILQLRATFASTVMMLTAFAAVAAGAEYPNRPITLTVSTTAGASPDLIARLFAKELSDGFKVPVVVENKGGANGQIAAQAIANAPPDGYSLLATTGATLTINPVLHPAAARVTAQLAPVTKLANQDFVVAVRPSLKVRTLSDLIAWSRKNPGKLNVATTALGSLAYLTAQLLKEATGIKFVTITHNGGGQAVTSVLGNNADVLIETITLSRPYIESGKLVALAVTGSKRSTYLPDVPTLIQSNVNVVTSGWTAIVAPKDTPPDILERIQQELHKGLDNAGIRKTLDDMSAEPVVDAPGDFGREWEREEKMWSGVIKKAGITVD